ncbi:uncharacterized protein LOC113332924 [Papaver somniferum]|uniref:uncharacterized protein LOC113332924 n=1 Tax=Papaver somniferum TaxID=3469 RepID=UPI000E6F8D72|nr:uncharacterized protein LOC113332924 [Papaver somniferum]
MEKAFDNVKWDALFCISRKHGFGEKWVSWLQWCITSSNISLLAMAAQLLEDAMQRGQIHGFMVAENGIQFSHLQFADDTLIFLKAYVVKLNLDKSSMISVGADAIVKDLALEFGCKVEVMPIKYLGLPLGITARNATIWEDIIQRMEKKLALWKRKFLNKAGRLTLLKSCLASLPLYYLYLIHLHVAVEKKLTKIMRNFLWDSSEDKRKMCWVSWKKICTPISKGGLGAKNLKLTNFSPSF